MEKRYSQIFQQEPMSEILEGDMVVPVWSSRRTYTPVDSTFATLWEDEVTGLVVADPKKFEAWMMKTEIRLTF